jgi:hypothetical protein
MMETNPHACGVDDIAGALRAHQITPAAWMMTLQSFLFPVPFSAWVTSDLR